MTEPRHVLLIDGPSDTEAVLRAILEPRGAVVDRTRAHLAEQVWTSARPDVVVVDLDEPSTVAAEPVWTGTPHVLIGSARVTPANGAARFLEKPFQVPELIRAVEDLLAAADVA